MGKIKYGIVPLVIIQFCLISITYSQPSFLNHMCIDTYGNYTNTSTYKTNLNTVLSYVLSDTQTDNSGFYNVSAGHDPDQVNAIALCRGDATIQDCRKCVNDSVTLLPTLCPTQKEAVGWYDNCMLRYSNRSLLGISDETHVFYMRNGKNVTDPQQFNNALGDLLRKVQAKAASGDSQLKYATGGANVSSFERVFALAQCSPDLSYTSCFNCIGDFFRLFPNCCANRQGARVVGPSCSIRYEYYLFYSLPSSSPSPLPPVSPSLISTNSSSSSSSILNGNNGSHTAKISIIISISVIGTMAVAIGLCFLLRRKISSKRLIVDSLFKSEFEDDKSENALSLQYKFDTLREATNNFADANKLGQGGFGAVHKGRLPNGEEIAVKRLSQNSGQGDTEFKNEVLLLAKLQHRNLVRLKGYCIEEVEKLLVYEFVPNTSLDHLLFDPHRSSQLDWEKRYNIITGIARGILYLHEDSRLRIIHRDLKASNVLLDADMNAKIADFGMARLFEVDQTRGDTSKIAGTFGYMAPEYALHGFFSVKSDVYSFGVLLLEIITGKKCTGFQNGVYAEDLISLVWRNWSEGTPMSIVDPILSTGGRTEIMRCIHIGLLCVQGSCEDRPTMSSVHLMLSSSSLTLPMPSDPSSITLRGVDAGTHSSTRSLEHQSVNQDSITEFHAR